MKQTARILTGDNMKKELREKVWKKFGKHCAYCGCKLEYKDMQVDHLVPKALCGTDDYDNLMPSCRLCNYHKNTYLIEHYRKQLLLKIDRVKNSNVRLLEQYGIIEFNREPVVFYFEKHEAIIVPRAKRWHYNTEKLRSA